MSDKFVEEQVRVIALLQRGQDISPNGLTEMLRSGSEIIAASLNYYPFMKENVSLAISDFLSTVETHNRKSGR